MAAAGNPDRARDSFQRAIALDASHKVPVVRIGLGELELREKRYDAALEVADQLKTHFPDNVSGHDIAAAAYRGQEDAVRMLAEIEAATWRRPASTARSTPFRLSTSPL